MVTTPTAGATQLWRPMASHKPRLPTTSGRSWLTIRKSTRQTSTTSHLWRAVCKQQTSPLTDSSYRRRALTSNLSWRNCFAKTSVSIHVTIDETRLISTICFPDGRLSLALPRTMNTGTVSQESPTMPKQCDRRKFSTRSSLNSRAPKTITAAASACWKIYSSLWPATQVKSDPSWKFWAIAISAWAPVPSSLFSFVRNSRTRTLRQPVTHGQQASIALLRQPHRFQLVFVPLRRLLWLPR